MAALEGLMLPLLLLLRLRLLFVVVPLFVVLFVRRSTRLGR